MGYMAITGPWSQLNYAVYTICMDFNIYRALAVEVNSAVVGTLVKGTLRTKRLILCRYLTFKWIRLLLPWLLWAKINGSMRYASRRDSRDSGTEFHAGMNVSTHESTGTEGVRPVWP
jgi:hypothetical protein